ncbi:LOW QUALITY PROTEIN: hypothetical protein V2J09_002781 [Rumex salicifolius]
MAPWNLLLVLLHMVSFCTAQQTFLYSLCIDSNGNYTEDSTYKTNLDALLSDISSDTQINYGFYNLSAGQDPDKAYGIGLCRGDVSVADCRTCLYNSRLCPNQKEAIGWHDECMLRFSSTSIFQVRADFPRFYMSNPNNASDVDQFNEKLSDLVRGLRDKASLGDSMLKFAMGNASVDGFLNLYSYVQCTPDLNQLDCYNCLERAINEIPNCCASKEGGRNFSPSCNMRYEIYEIVKVDNSSGSAPPPPSLPLSLTPPPNPGNVEGKGDDTLKIVLIIWRKWRQGKVMDIVDRRLKGSSRHEIMRCMHIGLLCVQEEAEDRPTMSSVVVMLSNYTLSLPVPSHPAYVVNRSLVTNRVSRGRESQAFNKPSRSKPKGNPNTVNGIWLCRGDVLLDDCLSCLKNATANLFGVCPNQKQAIGWYDNCMVRYSNQSIYGVMEISPLYWIRNKFKALDPNNFDRVLSSLFDGLLNKTGVRFFRPSCNIRYEVYKFSKGFDSLALPNSSEPPSLPPTSPQAKGFHGVICILSTNTLCFAFAGKGSTTLKIVAVVVVAVIVVSLLLGVIIYLCLRRNRRKLKKTNILLQCAILSSSQPALAYYYCNSTYGNYTSNSIYKQNLNTLLSDIISNTKITSRFYNLSIVNGIAFFLFDCLDCLRNANLLSISPSYLRLLRYMHLHNAHRMCPNQIVTLVFHIPQSTFQLVVYHPGESDIRAEVDPQSLNTAEDESITELHPP